MCQPVSPSPNNDFQPVSTKMNSQLTSAMKKQSDIEGTTALRIPPAAPGAN
jgi:hypothetical protein